jgi:hypothetical protein
MEIFCPISLFNKDDLPAFGLPMMQREIVF